MPIQPLGDRAQSFALMRTTAALRQNMQRLTTELTTGRSTDVSARMDGRTGPLAQVTGDLSRLRAFETVISETQHRQGLQQIALGSLQSGASALADSALPISLGNDPAEITRIAQEARGTLQSSIAALNARDNGMPLFSGTLGVSSAIADAETILADIEVAILASGANTAEDVATAIADWFDTPGGGFETVAYLGNTTDPTPRNIGEGVSVTAGPRADAPEVRTLLQGIVTLALSDAATIPLDDTSRRTLILSGQIALRSGVDGTISLRANIGTAEERVSVEAVRNAAERNSLEMLHNAMTAIDPFETATALQEVQLQLETNYALTARMSRLSLLEYLR